MEGFVDGSGLFGVAGHASAGDLVLEALLGMQHRGARGTALAVGDGSEIRATRTLGNATGIPRGAMVGDRAIGQVIGGLGAPGIAGLPLDGGDRMVLAHGQQGSLACALAGRFTNGSRLRRELKEEGALFHSESDAEVLLHLVAQSSQKTRVNCLVDALWKLEGAFGLLVLGADVLVAVRDPRGFRPLYLGEVDGAVVVASEEAVFADVGGRVHRELQAGEMLIAHRDGVDTLKPFPPQPTSRCIQEVIGLARSDSSVFERSVHQARLELGERLGHDAPAGDGAVVVAVPGDEPYGMGYARSSGIPFRDGLATLSGGRITAVGAAVRAKSVVLVCRSLLTGHVLKSIVTQLRSAGAMEVHLRVATPPVQKACLYGVPSPTSEELAWTNRPDREEIALWLDATTVQFQAIQGLRGTLGANAWCQACLNGEQPVIPEEADDQLPLF